MSPGPIVILLGSFLLGGAERQAILLARYLRESCNADVRIVGLHKTGPSIELCESYGIPWQMVRFQWKYGRLAMLWELLQFAFTLRRLRPRVILSYTMLPNVACGVVWPFTGSAGFVWSQRDEGRERKPGFWENLAVRRSSCFISNSQHAASFLQNNLGAPKEKIRVIYNGVAPEPPLKTPEQWRAELSIPREALVATMVANLTRFKDHPTLLRAWRIVLDQTAYLKHRPVLLLAGRPDCLTDLKLLAYDLDLGRTVRFLGGVQDVAGLFQASNLCVFSSQFEGVPNGILEGMAAGLPVAATDIPGIREAVGEQSIPFLAAPASPEQLASRIILFLTDPSLRHEAGERNRQRIQQTFGVERMCSETLQVLTIVTSRLKTRTA